MQRVEAYPSLTNRAQNLVDVAPRFGVEPPTGFVEIFEDDPEADYQESLRFNLKVADEALAGLTDRLTREVNDLLSNEHIDIPSEHETRRILGWIKHVVPAKDPRSLADIVNAAWLAFEDATLWADIPELHKKRDDVLKELILKNIEIFEINNRLERVRHHA
jgi:hypothetical protein